MYTLEVCVYKLPRTFCSIQTAIMEAATAQETNDEALQDGLSNNVDSHVQDLENLTINDRQHQSEDQGQSTSVDKREEDEGNDCFTGTASCTSEAVTKQSQNQNVNEDQNCHSENKEYSTERHKCSAESCANETDIVEEGNSVDMRQDIDKENGEEELERVNHSENLNGENGECRGNYMEVRNDREIREVDNSENQDNQREDEENQNDNQGMDIEENGAAGMDAEDNIEDISCLDKVETKSENDTWTIDDITALLVKAINYRAPQRDLKTVIGCGADVNRPMRNGLCPLHYAAYSDYAECVKLLLNSGANVNATDDIGYTPVHLAARRGNSQSLEILIENGAIINYNEPGTEIHQTDEKNKLGYTTLEPLNLAIQNGHPICAKLLLENGARPNNKYFMGFEICLAPLDEPECLELLLQYGANPNVFNRCGLSPLMKACKDHRIEAARKLIKYGADVNALCPPLFEQKSVLQFAINSGNIVMINILLGKGVTLERQGEYRYSALHSGVIKGKAEICRLLLQNGADPNERTDDGATAMMLACSTPNLADRREIVQLLLDCGADLNAHSPGYSYFDPYLAPLTEYFKCIGSSEGFSIVRLLIRNGAKVTFSASGLDLEQKRLRDPFSIVPYMACMENSQAIFDLVCSAASKYSPLTIHATDSIPEFMKDILLYAATRPRELKHLVRVAIRDQLTPGLPNKVSQLPIPPLIQDYLLFR